jgi:lysophospholipase L1-like esterase
MTGAPRDADPPPAHPTARGTLVAAPQPKRRRWPFAVAALLLGLLLAVTGVEVGLRVTDPLGRNYDVEFTRYKNEALRYAWDGVPPDQLDSKVDLDGTLFRHKPGLTLDLGSFVLRTNTLGFRGPEVAAAKGGDVFRVLVLGDSVAFGWGVDDAVTFVRRFEREQPLAGGKRLEVVNTGHLVYDTMQQLALLRDEGMRLQPDLVLLVYVVNDIEPTRDVVEESLLGKPPDPAEALPPDPGDFWTGLAGLCDGLLPATATLLRLQSDPAARLLRALPPGTEYAPERFGKGPRGWQRSQRALLAMADLCAQAQVPFAVLDHTLPKIESLPPFCREHQIRCFDFRFTQAELDQPIRNSLLDTHANAKGHELLLQKLQSLVPELLPPR